MIDLSRKTAELRAWEKGPRPSARTSHQMGRALCAVGLWIWILLIVGLPPEQVGASGLKFEKLSWDGGSVGPVEVKVSYARDNGIGVMNVLVAPFAWRIDGLGSGIMELGVSSSHAGVSRKSIYSLQALATGYLTINDGAAKYLEIQLASEKSADSPSASAELEIRLGEDDSGTGDGSGREDNVKAIMKMVAEGHLEFSQNGISSATGTWEWKQNYHLAPHVYAGDWNIEPDQMGHIRWKLGGEFRSDQVIDSDSDIDETDEDEPPPVFQKIVIGGTVGGSPAELSPNMDMEVTAKLTDLTIPGLIRCEDLEVTTGFRRLESTAVTTASRLPVMDRLLEPGSLLDAVEISVTAGYFEIADYWKGADLTLRYSPDGRKLHLSAPDSALHWEYFDRIVLSGTLEGPEASFSLNLDNETISIASLARILRQSHPAGRETAVDIHHIHMKFDDTYGLSGMYPDLPNFVTSAVIDGRASLEVPDQPELSPTWGAEMRIDGDELGFPDLSITLESIGSSFRIASPPSGRPNPLPSIVGRLDIEKVEIPEVEISPIRIVFSENDMQEQYVTLEEAEVFGGSFSSSPIYLGKAPDKVAVHLNVLDLDGHQITRMIKDFNGSLEGKLNGQLAIQWNNPRLRFQYGHFYLNNPDESRLQWNADGILTKQMNPGQWTYKKSREMEAAISHLNIREMNVFVTNQSDQQDLMKVFMNGVPIDGSLKNPVHLNFNLKGRWQSLIDYLFKGSGMKLDFSIN